MAGTALSLLIFAIVLIPAVCATWGYERFYEAYSRRAKDWAFKLAGISCILFVVAAGPVYWFLAEYWERIKNLESLSWWLWLAPVAYIALPTLLGMLFGWMSSRAGQSWTSFFQVFRGSRVAPTAWDYIFERHPAGLFRCKLQSGQWVGGMYHQQEDRFGHAPPSYAGAEPGHRDIYISDPVEIDQTTGQPKYDEAGNLVWLAKDPWPRAGLLIKWENIEVMFFEAGYWQR